MEDKINEFQKSIKYKFIGFLIILTSVIPLSLFKGSLGYPLAIIGLIIGIYFLMKYRCPYCKVSFDPRLKSKNLMYCPYCGELLILPEDF